MQRLKVKKISNVKTPGNSHGFLWNHSSIWVPRIAHLLSDVLTKKVFHELREHPPRYFVSDNLSWLNNTISSVTNQEEDVVSLLKLRLPKVYSEIHAFHGCRPVSLGSYQKSGLIPANVEKLEQLAYNQIVNE